MKLFPHEYWSLENWSLTNIASTYVTNNVPANVTSTVPINPYNKKVKYKMDCYILNTFLSVICDYS